MTSNTNENISVSRPILMFGAIKKLHARKVKREKTFLYSRKITLRTQYTPPREVKFLPCIVSARETLSFCMDNGSQ